MFFKEYKKYILSFLLLLLFCGCSSGGSENSGNPGGNYIGDFSADHTKAKLSVLESIPDSARADAKSGLVIAYGHTSHGSQIVDGLNGLDAFMTGKGHSAGEYSGLVINDFYGNFGGLSTAQDLGNPDYTAWESATRTYLDTHSGVNVIVWSWCGQVSGSSEDDISNYLSLMNGLEQDYPDVKFVYMTGHLDGTGLAGNLHLRNEQIRKYCSDNNKILFDFADIESYDPDGTYYGDRHPTDGCNYDHDGDGVTSQTGDPAEPSGADKNWATEWQNNNPGLWYSCSAAHSKAVNANMKAYAFWWLMARISGWEK